MYTAMIVGGILLLIFLLVLVLVFSERSRERSDLDKAEYKRLKKLERDLTKLAMSHYVSDPFAVIVMDEINNSKSDTKHIQ